MPRRIFRALDPQKNTQISVESSPAVFDLDELQERQLHSAQIMDA